MKVRIEAHGAELAALLARARAEGLDLVLPGEDAELVARPSPVSGPSTAESLAPRPIRAGAAVARGGEGLSRRELEILEYLVDGWSNAEIASVLGIGLRTVRFHLEGIFSKLQVSRRGEAAREALRLGLVRFDF